MKHEKQKSPVRLARDAAGLSQVDLALRAGKSIATVRLAEAGVITLNTAKALAPVLGVEPAALMPSATNRAA